MKSILKSFFGFLALFLGAGAVCCAQHIEGVTHLDAEAFAKYLAEHLAAQLVDARTAAEYAEGHIAGAVNIDVRGQNFKEGAAKLDKSRPVAVYCRSGKRSKTAAKILKEMGYEIVELDKGILSWKGELEK